MPSMYDTEPPVYGSDCEDADDHLDTFGYVDSKVAESENVRLQITPRNHVTVTNIVPDGDLIVCTRLLNEIQPT